MIFQNKYREHTIFGTSLKIPKLGLHWGFCVLWCNKFNKLNGARSSIFLANKNGYQTKISRYKSIKYDLLLTLKINWSVYILALV